MQHDLSYDVSLFDPAMCLDDAFEGNTSVLSGIVCGPITGSPDRMLTRHLTIKSQSRDDLRDVAWDRRHSDRRRAPLSLGVIRRSEAYHHSR